MDKEEFKEMCKGMSDSEKLEHIRMLTESMSEEEGEEGEDFERSEARTESVERGDYSGDSSKPKAKRKKIEKFSFDESLMPED